MAKDQKIQNTPVTGTIPATLREAIEEYRWENRMTVSEVVREALEVWAEQKGISTPDETAEPTDEQATESKTSRTRK